jgi:hypothetical protein
MSSTKRVDTRGRATLLFACCLATMAVYLLLARPDGLADLGAMRRSVDSQERGFSVDTIGSSTRRGSTQRAKNALSSILGSHTLLTGSVTDQILEDPQESLATLLEEQKRLRMEESVSNCGDDETGERVDPLPGNNTGRFHGSCRSQYPPTVPNLLVRQIWKSSKMRKMTDVSLVTHLTLDQLPKLEFQCETWTSRIAAAVYVKMPYPQAIHFDRIEPAGGSRKLNEGDEGFGDGYDDVDDDEGASAGDSYGNAGRDEGPDDALVHETLVAAEKEVGAFFDKVHELQLPCTLDVLLAYEEYTANDPWLQLYPINALRNKALQLADAENVLVVDVDTVPNADLSHELHIMSLYETLNRVLNNRQVIVLPTVTVVSNEELDPLQTSRLVNRSLEGIDRLKSMNEKGKIGPHRTVRSPQAQEDLDLQAWFNASAPFVLEGLHQEYEPVFMAKRATLPWYDERFRGLKLNRCVCLTV